MAMMNSYNSAYGNNKVSFKILETLFIFVPLFGIIVNLSKALNNTTITG